MTRTLNQLRTELLNSDEPTSILLNELRAFATKKGSTVDLIFFAALPKMTANAWRAFDEANPLVAAPRIGRQWFAKDQDDAELAQQCCDVMEENFVLARAAGSYRTFKISDRDRQIVEPVLSGDDGDLDFARHLAPVLKKDGFTIREGHAAQIRSFASIHGQLFNALPSLCLQPDEQGWCLHRISILPDANIEMPYTEAFLARINDPEAFAAWMYGLASNRYRGRQVLWLKGKGEDGKSTFFKAFSKIFGITAGAVDWNMLKNSPTFVGSLFVDKRFVYVPDNANPNLLMTEIFKSLAAPGSDPVTINHKYGKMYTTELEAHVAILSNYDPAISGERHNTSRTLYLTIDPRDLSSPNDPTIIDKFVRELPGFLAFGKECYEKLCINDATIKTNENVAQAVADRIADSNEDWTALFDELFYFEEGEKVVAQEAYKSAKEAGVSKLDWANFKRWLSSSLDIEAKQARDGKRYFYNMRHRNAQDDRKNVVNINLKVA